MSNSGNLAAVATSENITVFDLADRKVIREIPLKIKSPHTTGVALAPDSKTVAYAVDGGIRFVEVDTGKSAIVIRGVACAATAHSLSRGHFSSEWRQGSGPLPCNWGCWKR